MFGWDNCLVGPDDFILKMLTGEYSTGVRFEVFLEVRGFVVVSEGECGINTPRAVFCG